MFKLNSSTPGLFKHSLKIELAIVRTQIAYSLYSVRCSVLCFDEPWYRFSGLLASYYLISSLNTIIEFLAMYWTAWLCHMKSEWHLESKQLTSIFLFDLKWKIHDRIGKAQSKILPLGNRSSNLLEYVMPFVSNVHLPCPFNHCIA